VEKGASAAGRGAGEPRWDHVAWSSARSAGNAPARALYTAAGFVEEGILRGEFHLEGRDVDDVLMARALRADP